MDRLKHVSQFLSGAKTVSSSKPPYFLSFRSSTALIVIAGKSTVKLLGLHVTRNIKFHMFTYYIGACLKSWDKFH